MVDICIKYLQVHKFCRVDILSALSPFHSKKSSALIGAYKDNNETHPFDEKIAEVRLWKVARTQQEIQKNLHQPLVGNELGLVGYWPLNEGSSNTAYDKTSNAMIGIINGANLVAI
jgi:hypothetical protein